MALALLSVLAALVVVTAHCFAGTPAPRKRYRSPFNPVTRPQPEPTIHHKPLQTSGSISDWWRTATGWFV
jgi:hypothetical protein